MNVREMSAGQMAKEMLSLRGAAPLPNGGPATDRETDTVCLLGDLATFERRINNVVSDLANIADRMWGCTLRAASSTCKEDTGPGSQLDRIRLVVANLGDTIGRLENEAGRFERLA